MPTTTVDRAEKLLDVLAGRGARLRPDQGEAIAALVDDRARVLLVQATGWGKSAVYWIATALRRAAGAGPTLVVSPLLALMRNQVEAARRLGLRAETINSANVEAWETIVAALDADRIDVLLISPERLNAASFRDRVTALAGRVGLLVVDEAHCISDWGHDFRPDYRRIAEVLATLPAGTPVLACTATANARVTEDVAAQLASGAGGEPTRTLRGELGRDSLRLAVVALTDAQRRLAWLAAYVASQRPAHGRAGVVYTLTVAEAERTAAFLRTQGLEVAAYTSAVDAERRERLESLLAVNELDALVATSALGMGYDKPDLAFVVHLGAPSSPVAYYQQVGRAGRAIDHAEVVLLPTGSQEAIWEFFDVTGVPSQREGEDLLGALRTDEPRSLPLLERAVNLRRSRLELLLKVLDVDGAVRKQGSGWLATGAPWAYDAQRYTRLVRARRAEHAAMRRLSRGEITGCLMAFLRASLDDHPSACGRCQACSGWEPQVEVAPTTIAAARDFLRSRDVLVRPRRRWPTGLADVKGNIGEGRRAVEGRALAGSDDSGWGAQVGELLTMSEAGRHGDPRHAVLCEEVVEGLVKVLARWEWPARPQAIVAVPSLEEESHSLLARELADRIGALGRLPVIEGLASSDGRSQTDAANSAHKAANALARLSRSPAPLPDGPVLAVTARVDSGWTLTVAAWRLTEDVSRSVLPLALTLGP
ncbi:MAG: RecQ family ATP-dependent DNA helicase [Egibacteraceae bacterium]